MTILFLPKGHTPLQSLTLPSTPSPNFPENVPEMTQNANKVMKSYKPKALEDTEGTTKCPKASDLQDWGRGPEVTA